jgi:hypothetical protein
VPTFAKATVETLKAAEKAKTADKVATDKATVATSPPRFEFGAAEDFQLNQAMNHLKGQPVLTSTKALARRGEDAVVNAKLAPTQNARSLPGVLLCWPNGRRTTSSLQPSHSAYRSWASMPKPGSPRPTH